MIHNEFLKEIATFEIQISEEEILDRLFDTYRWPASYPWGQPTVELIDKQLDCKVTDIFSDGWVDSSKVFRGYNDGHTLVLSNIGNLFKDFRVLQQKLNRFFNKNIGINLYMGKGTERVSFNKHNHPYDVIVKNIFGESHWLINDKKYVLSDQTVFHLPKFTYHEVIKINNCKCSLTCNIE